MAASIPAPTITLQPSAIPAALLNVCFVLCVINISYFPAAYFSHWWIYDPDGLGIPTDFVNVWAAGRLALEGHPAWSNFLPRQGHLVEIAEPVLAGALFRRHRAVAWAFQWVLTARWRWCWR